MKTKVKSKSAPTFAPEPEAPPKKVKKATRPEARPDLEGVTSFFVKSFPRDLHHQFKMECTRQGRSMAKTVIEIIRGYVAENGGAE